MDLHELTAEMNRLVESKGWYSPESRRPQQERNIAISLSLEAAEILELYQWSDQPANREALGSEMADVLLYLVQLANLAGIDLEAATQKKIKINYQRVWDVPQPEPGKEMQ